MLLLSPSSVCGPALTPPPPSLPHRNRLQLGQIGFLAGGRGGGGLKELRRGLLSERQQHRWFLLPYPHVCEGAKSLCSGPSLPQQSPSWGGSPKDHPAAAGYATFFVSLALLKRGVFPPPPLFLIPRKHCSSPKYYKKSWLSSVKDAVSFVSEPCTVRHCNRNMRARRGSNALRKRVSLQRLVLCAEYSI